MIPVGELFFQSDVDKLTLTLLFLVGFIAFIGAAPVEEETQDATVADPEKEIAADEEASQEEQDENKKDEEDDDESEEPSNDEEDEPQNDDETNQRLT
ncbi:hypothetical protein QZH41_006101 [Actinostola sp. cb2023]|nr:hypothetical protein QZH41_006101 [Actinostola sp. cb2023]